jgi:hypothetical protein
MPVTKESIEGLEWTGRPFGGIIDDIKRRIPYYKSDFTDGLNTKTIGTTIFLFFAALANAIAFGALTGLLTGNEIGVIEMLVVTAAGGIFFALFSGQPLTILGGTGPITIFTGLLYITCSQLEISFLATYAWVGIWSGIILLILAFTDASALMAYFTRFTDEIFAALISVIFIVEAVKDIFTAFGPQGYGLLSAFFSLILALGTFFLARFLRNSVNTPFLWHTLREFLADFGPSIAILAMTMLALFYFEIPISKPVVPETFGTTSGRDWLVPLFDVPMWVIFGSIVPAILATILLFLDQNITTRLVNSKDNKLKKGTGYHLDLAIVGIIILGGSFFALPWIVAATVHSLNHVRSQAKVAVVDVGGQKKEKIVSVRETRLSGFFVHVLIAVSLLFLGYFALIPMAVLFGLFLYMGVASLNGNQFFDRMTLWVTDPKLYPKSHYVNKVPHKIIHLFTLLQFTCFAVLWVLKTSPIGILFPLMIAALVPIRYYASKLFHSEHIDALLLEDEEEDEKMWGDLG